MSSAAGAGSQATFKKIDAARPSPGNSMGGIKFMIPNDFGIYLHDTQAGTVLVSVRFPPEADVTPPFLDAQDACREGD